MQQIRSVKILATGKYLPQKKVTAQELAQRLGIDEDWIIRKSGVLVRYFVEDETSSMMGALAAKQALERANLTLDDIDCLVCTSSVPQQAIPCTASLVQKLLGGEDSGIPAFDINATCLSFLVGLDTLSYLIAAGRYQRILLIATEVCAGINWQDKESSTLFGDGAAAAIITKSENHDISKIICSRLETYSKGASLSECRGGGNLYHPQEYGDRVDELLFKMDGKGIFRLAREILPSFMERLLSATGLTISDLNLIIPHQASLMAMELMRKTLGVSPEKWMTIAHNHGNTVAASIPMALHEAIMQKRIKRGDSIMLLGTAAGFSVGAIILDY